MTTLPLIIPDLKKSILFPLLSTDRTEEKYLDAIYRFERDCEQSLIETFQRVGINATVKSDVYSLPYKEEIVHSLAGESYMNGPYEFYRVARVILKEILNTNIYKLRFYMFVHVDTTPSAFHLMGKVIYHFRYYPH